MAPSGLAQDSTGQLYVADSATHVLMHVSSVNGTLSVWVGSFGVSGYSNDPLSGVRFNSPTCVVFEPMSNSMLVCDTGNNIIRRVSVASYVSLSFLYIVTHMLLL